MKMSNDYEWCRKGIKKYKDRLQDLNISDFKMVKNEIINDKYFHIPRV